MILTFPYHDPRGKFNDIFKKNFVPIQNLFRQTIISVTPATQKTNAAFIKDLLDNGFIVFQNKEGSTIADHSKNALKTALTKATKNECIFFSFIDRKPRIFANRYLKTQSFNCYNLATC